MERNTIQRQEIIEVLKNSYNHPTIKELCELVSDKNIGQATVYRTVKSLVSDDIIRRVECPDGIHYDYRKNHYHFYCLKCNKITDVFLDKNIIDNMLSALASNLKDVRHINLVFEGICDSCKGKSSYGIK